MGNFEILELRNFAQHLNFYIFSITTSTFDLPYILLMKMAFEIENQFQNFPILQFPNYLFCLYLFG